ncbi:MAG TPA: cbb3-type cytochrome c oxidase N-terminal domain-containing protein [Flavipsychrobacter sp.]
MRKYFNKQLLLSMAVLSAPAAVFAADGAAKAGNSFNPLLMGLLGLIIVLLFVIGMMGSTLVQLGYAYRAKMRKERNGGSGIVKAVLFLLAFGTMSFSAVAQEAAVAAPGPTSIGGLPEVEFYVLIGAIMLELLTIGVLIVLTRVLIKAIMLKPGEEEAKAAAIAKTKRVPFWDRFNAAVAIEKEEDIMLDHDYDGIKELDNSLPPWWKYGFYLTIVIGVVYVWYYHFGSGPSQEDEFLAEVKKGEQEVAAYLAKSANNVDENTVVMLDMAGIEAGKGIFTSNCAACHAADGGGNAVGPNLTDKYWLHGGSLQEVFKSIKYGWPSKGMKSWKDDFSPVQIAQLASFVKSLQGTTPAAPKEPQGEIYIEATEGTDNTDSTKELTSPGIAAIE